MTMTAAGRTLRVTEETYKTILTALLKAQTDARDAGSTRIAVQVDRALRNLGVNTEEIRP